MRRALTVQQLAEDLGPHANTVRFHLTRLTKDGQVREGRVGLGGPGRPELTYEATTGRPAGSAGTAEREGNGYRLLAQILAGHPAATSDSPSRDAVAAGQEWGRHLTERPAPFSSISAEGAFGKITALMDRLGFETERSDDPPLLRIHRCPFLSVAEERPDVACSVHLGLMRGALQEMGAPSTPPTSGSPTPPARPASPSSNSPTGPRPAPRRPSPSNPASANRRR